MILNKLLPKLNQRGFSHVEILVVVAVIAIIGVLGVRQMNFSSAATVPFATKTQCTLMGRTWNGSTTANPCNKVCAAGQGSYVVTPTYDYCSNAVTPASSMSLAMCNQYLRVPLASSTHYVGCARLTTRVSINNAAQCSTAGKKYYHVRTPIDICEAVPVAAPAPTPKPPVTPPTTPTPTPSTAVYTTLPVPSPLSTDTSYAAYVAWKAEIARATALKLTGQALINDLIGFKQKYDDAVNSEALTYVTLPVAPATTSTTYAAYVAWKAEIARANALKLTGLALINDLRVVKTAYEAAVKAASSALALSCTGTVTQTFSPAVAPTMSITAINTNKNSTLTANTYYAVYTTKNVIGTTVKLNVLARTSLTPANLGTALNYTLAAPFKVSSNGGIVTLYTTVQSADGKTVIPCGAGSSPSYVTYDLTSGKTIATPAGNLPIAVTPTPTPPKPGDGGGTGGGGGAPGPRQKPAVASLGYKPLVYCVTQKSNDPLGKNLTPARCAQANAVVVVIAGKQADPTKEKLAYDLTIAKVKLPHVTTCTPRYIVTTGRDINATCTILYSAKAQNIFSSIATSVSNKFKSIVISAAAEKNLTKSKANADLAKLKAAGSVNAAYTVTLSYPGYTSQVVSDTMNFSYTAPAVDIAAINNSIDGTASNSGSSTTSKPTPTPPTVTCSTGLHPSGTTYCAPSLKAVESFCASHFNPAQTWYKGDCHSAAYIAKVSGVKNHGCSLTQHWDSIDGCVDNTHGCSVTQHYDSIDGCVDNGCTSTQQWSGSKNRCVNLPKTYLPNSKDKATCKQLGGTYTGSYLKGWKCVGVPMTYHCAQSQYYQIKNFSSLSFSFAQGNGTPYSTAVTQQVNGKICVFSSDYYGNPQQFTEKPGYY